MLYIGKIGIVTKCTGMESCGLRDYNQNKCNNNNFSDFPRDTDDL